MYDTKHFYSTALICEGGHILCTNLEKYPEQNIPYCPKCHEPCISKCPHCGAPIHGDFMGIAYPHSTYLNARGYVPSEYPEKRVLCIQPINEPPAFCYNCSSPYPWTKQLLEEAEKIVDLMDDLTEEQKNILKGCFPDLITDTIKTTTSALTVEKILRSVSRIPVTALQNILYTKLTDTALTFLGWK